METTVINATEYRNVSLSLLSESKTNPRGTFEDATLKELAEVSARKLFSRHLFEQVNRGSGIGGKNLRNEWSASLY